MISRLFALFALCFLFAGSAMAEVKVAVVDFQRALNEVNEAAGVRAKLEGMYGERKAAIEKMQKSLEAKKSEYEKQASILSDSARKAKEEELMKASVEFQQTYSKAEGEMQQAYYAAMQDFIEKMKKISVAIGQERGYTVVLEATEGGVVYWSDSVDITDEMIKRYNAANPATPAKK
jgi:outer membrane protein